MLEIELSDFTLRFGTRTIFHRVSTTLRWDSGDDANRVIGLMGRSGAGKTTLAREILAARYEGGRAGLGVRPGGATVAYLPQAAVLFSHLSAHRNARLFEGVGRYRRHFDPALFEQLTDILQLHPVLKAGGSVDRLSGGEAQRIMLLRTLSIRPDLLIMDEPASGLDPSVRDSFLIDLQDILGRLRIAALYITHSWPEAAFLAGRIAYADTRAPEGRVGPIADLPVVDAAKFHDSPPDIDAFRTVYGPGCSVWPLKATGRIACIGARTGRASGFRRLSGAFRISEEVLGEMQVGTVDAAVYVDGGFVAWEPIGREQLDGLPV